MPVETKENVIEQLIIRLLDDFPKITKSMIAAHVSPVAAEYGVDYRQVLKDLVHRGVINVDIITRENKKRVPVYQLAKAVH